MAVFLEYHKHLPLHNLTAWSLGYSGWSLVDQYYIRRARRIFRDYYRSFYNADGRTLEPFGENKVLRLFGANFYQ